MLKAIIFDLDNTLIDFMRMKKLSCDAAISAMIGAGLNTSKEKATEELFALYDKYGLEVKAEFNASMQNLAEIEAHRKKVDEKSIAYTDALGYYSNVISEMITSLSHISKTSSDPQMVLLLSAYIDFLKAKEMMGIERAIGTNTISEDNFGPGLYVYFVSVVSAQEVYLDSYRQKVSKEQLSYLNNKLANPVVDETLEIRKNLIENGSVGGFGISAPDWFDLMTKKIDLLKEIEERLYTDIAKKSMVLKSDAKFELYAVIFTSLLSILVLVICILVWR